jgi:hypothetical protein
VGRGGAIPQLLSGFGTYARRARTLGCGTERQTPNSKRVSEEIDYAAGQKREWLKRNHLEIDEDCVVLVPGRRAKRAFARPGHILIDDWQPAIFAWEESGGTGIWYPPQVR